MSISLMKKDLGKFFSLNLALFCPCSIAKCSFDSIDKYGQAYLYHEVECQTIPFTVGTCVYFCLSGEKSITRLNGRLDTSQYIGVLKQVMQVSRFETP